MEYLRLEPNSESPSVKVAAPYRTVIVAEEEVSAEWQAKVSRWLVETGCLYTLVWGTNCSSWDDSVDLANLEAFNYQEIPKEKLVMTTWHQNEPLTEVFWFAKNIAYHPEVELVTTLILHISLRDRGEEFKGEFASA